MFDVNLEGFFYQLEWRNPPFATAVKNQRKSSYLFVESNQFHTLGSRKLTVTLVYIGFIHFYEFGVYWLFSLTFNFSHLLLVVVNTRHHPMRLLIRMVARAHHRPHRCMAKAHFIGFGLKHFESVWMHIAAHWNVRAAGG